MSRADAKVNAPCVLDISEAAYHADRLTPEPSLSSTLARIILAQSPLHAWTASPRLNPGYQPRHSEAFDIGRSFHTMLLGKGAPIEVVSADNWTTKAAREARDEARSAGKTPMLEAQFNAALDMCGIAMDRLELFGVSLTAARNELAAFAPIDGVWCRALIDHAPEDPAQPLYDVKSCEDASPEACIRAVTSYGYATQAAHYLETWSAATGERRSFRFVFVEKSAPHEVSVIELFDDPGSGADWFVAEQDKAKTARAVWRHCLKTGQWPGYEARVAVVGAPAFFATKWESRARPSHEVLALSANWQAPWGAA